MRSVKVGTVTEVMVPGCGTPRAQGSQNRASLHTYPAPSRISPRRCSSEGLGRSLLGQNRQRYSDEDEPDGQ